MNGEGDVEHDVVLLKRNRWRLLAMAWPLIFVVGGSLMVAGGDGAGVSFALMGLAVGLVSLGHAFEDNVNPRAIPARLAIAGGCLTVDGQSYDVDALRSGYMLPGEPPRIRLHVAERRFPVDIALSSRDDAEATLELLDLSPSQRIATFRAFVPQGRGWRGVLEQLAIIAPFLVGMFSIGPPTAWVAPMFLAVFAARFWRRRVHVGSDGVRLERGVLFDRFIRHEAISSMRLEHTADKNAVHVVMQVDGEKEARAGFRTQQQANAFIERVEAAGRARGEGQPMAEALARGDAAVSDWVARLRAATSVGSHRTAAVAHEHLWRLVEGPSVEPLQRAAAAIALRDHLDDSSKKRIADVAASTASPRLRLVLEQVTEDADDEAVVEALAELEAAGERRR
ncbi:MAG: hypothetical protein RIF41_12610 [Polyangiaceae bacterium]